MNLLKDKALIPLVVRERIEELGLTVSLPLPLLEKTLIAYSIYIEPRDVWRDLFSHSYIEPFIHFHFPCGDPPRAIFTIKEAVRRYPKATDEKAVVEAYYKTLNFLQIELKMGAPRAVLNSWIIDCYLDESMNTDYYVKY